MADGFRDRPRIQPKRLTEFVAPLLAIRVSNRMIQTPEERSTPNLEEIVDWGALGPEPSESYLDSRLAPNRKPSSMLSSAAAT